MSKWRTKQNALRNIMVVITLPAYVPSVAAVAAAAPIELSGSMLVVLVSCLSLSCPKCHLLLPLLISSGLMVAFLYVEQIDRLGRPPQKIKKIKRIGNGRVKVLWFALECEGEKMPFGVLRIQRFPASQPARQPATSFPRDASALSSLV
uniref:Uncharacterized protein n=1 Tax=Anopheles darlingi TaxID=43151 RepID=A0A2M4DIM2_ANODA